MPEDIVVDDEDNDAVYWHVFDVIDRDVLPYNCVTCLSVVDLPWDVAY